MAGFAVSLDYLENSPNATMPYRAGYEEDEFLKSIGLRLSEIEPKAKNCSQILVWHTQTKKEKQPAIHIDHRVLDTDDTSLRAVLHELQLLGVSHTTNSNSGSDDFFCIYFCFRLHCFRHRYNLFMEIKVAWINWKKVDKTQLQREID